MVDSASSSAMLLPLTLLLSTGGIVANGLDLSKYCTDSSILSLTVKDPLTSFDMLDQLPYSPDISYDITCNEGKAKVMGCTGLKQLNGAKPVSVKIPEGQRESKSVDIVIDANGQVEFQSGYAHCKLVCTTDVTARLDCRRRAKDWKYDKTT